MTVWEALAAFWASHWHLHPDRLVLVGGLGGLYVIGLAARGRGQSREIANRAPAFALGLGALAVAVLSPLHDLSDRYLFSAHMAQHQLLTLVAPPLLLLGLPGWLLPVWLRQPALAAFGRSTLYPISAFAAFNLVFALVHFPRVYEALFGDELLHFLTHGVLVLAALWTWMPLFSPVSEVLPRLPLPGQMLYVFLQAIPGSLVGSLITLADRLIYRHYGAMPLELGVDPLADQQVGGLLMWVVSGSYFLLILTVLFFVWADQSEKQEGDALSLRRGPR